jgi:hypothetical protein
LRAATERAVAIAPAKQYGRMPAAQFIIQQRPRRLQRRIVLAQQLLQQ